LNDLHLNDLRKLLLLVLALGLSGCVESNRTQRALGKSAADANEKVIEGRKLTWGTLSQGDILEIKKMISEIPHLSNYRIHTVDVTSSNVVVAVEYREAWLARGPSGWAVQKLFMVSP
jgi:hypothetical protein